MAPLMLGGQNAKGVIGGKSPARLKGAITLRKVVTRSVGNDLVVEGDL
jgi:diaminohydroxyphosphoribosylaminopyrimidine deaminase/5-amino-6-(5-phosphoribosylamino)uracil reductase